MGVVVLGTDYKDYEEQETGLLDKLKAFTFEEGHSCAGCSCLLNAAGSFKIWEVCSKLCNGTAQDVEFWNSLDAPLECLTKDIYEQIVDRFCVVK